MLWFFSASVEGRKTDAKENMFIASMKQQIIVNKSK
jgi:hypothetical protein